MKVEESEKGSSEAEGLGSESQKKDNEPRDIQNAPDTSSRTSSYQGYTNEVSDEVQSIARTLTIGDEEKSTAENERYRLALTRTLSHMSRVPGKAPFGEDYIDERLDPTSDNFDSKLWVKNLRKLYNSDPEYYKPVDLGVAFKNLRAYGEAAGLDYQSNFKNLIYKYFTKFVHEYVTKRNDYTDILKPMDGLVRPGEITVVLGRPGSGCTTFLKTIAAQTYGFHVDPESEIFYDGVTPKEVKKNFRGDVVYCAETEVHFPQLTVGDTLAFAARMRTPQNRPQGISREAYAKHLTNVVMATYGLSHTKDTKVGDDYIRGVSGGERKRVSIAEVALTFAKIQCWDNSTRGLDAATALEFVRALRVSANVLNATPLLAIYQCSQDAYDLFDKVLLLYEGYEIFFGNCKEAKDYFVQMGFYCHPRRTTADFLTSITSPAERRAQKGFENKVPRTAEEFYQFWQKSVERTKLLKEIDEYVAEQKDGDHRQVFSESHVSSQASHTPKNVPYTVSYFMQVRYIMGRNILRMKGSPSIPLFQVISHILMGLIISSIFYNMPSTTGSFYSRCTLLFFALLFNAFSCILEIFSLYEARPIVEKHKGLALYYPSADSVASIITELPNKIIICIFFNLIIYFMSNLRREPGNFFFYLLINFTATLAMSHLFRSIGSATKSLEQAMTPASILLLGMTIFTGFVIPTPKMHGWCRWINWINPLGYAFESLVVNEFHERDFRCSQFVPQGGSYPTSGLSIVCYAVGAVAGQPYVNGDDYVGSSYRYYSVHRWRNWGIMVGFVVFFFFVYIGLCEINKGARQKGEILLFQEGAYKKDKKQIQDLENGQRDEKALEEPNESEDNADNKLPSQGRIFHWKNLTYEVKIKGELRTILNDIDGWVKPGQVTALMGASGAGKTTLLNALSERITSGVISAGTRMVNGKALDDSFQRSIGYVQQQDLHLQTATVRESLKFAAYLRQPFSVPKSEKDAYVNYIIDLLEMNNYADAIVGVTGEGLNVEQRKRLSIGVELVAKPKLLLFLDEPTSGLDSQTAWSICKLIRKLADHGQAILCTIHQPSALLLEDFDRLLFLKSGGQTVYFGDLGKGCRTLINYFEKYGAPKCPPDANPAEWMLLVIGAAPGSHANQDYFDVWRNSSEYQDVLKELKEMETELPKRQEKDDPDLHKLFATPLWYQYLIVLKRVFEQYWRSPSYTYSKVILGVLSAIFNGFSFFRANKSIQGLQNQMFSVFMFYVVLIPMIQQYLPYFVSQRSLYEIRERPSKTFSWFAFITAQISAEIPWQLVIGTASFFCWYYPIGFYNNAAETDTVNQRGGYMWFLIALFYIYSQTLGQLCISFFEKDDNAANLSTILFTVCLAFCGVVATKESLPGFWIFMYRCSPFTYLVAAMLSTGLAHSSVECAENEILGMVAPQGYNCGEYLEPYMQVAGGYLLNPNSTSTCLLCPVSLTDVFLNEISANYNNRGRDAGIFIAFIGINVVGTIFFYWLTRVPKGKRQK